jgi:hypothetical protein
MMSSTVCAHLVLSLLCCTQSAVWCRAVEPLDTVAVTDEWSIVLASHCNRTVDVCLHALQVLTTLTDCTSCSRMMALT